MTEIADRYRRLAEAFTATVDAVADDAWHRPSPCGEFDARGVVQHVTDTQRSFFDRFADLGVTFPAVADDPLTAWPVTRDAVQAMLDDPDVAGRSYEGFFGPTTIEATIDRFYCADLLIHRWDIARATGLTEHEPMDPADVARYTEIVNGYGPAARAPGVFGPEIEVPGDASAQDRLLAFTGRDPR